MTGRHVGTVCHLNPAENYAEIEVAGMMPVGCHFADLRGLGADKIGEVVEFELGAKAPVGFSGAVKLSRPASVP
jgi:hypothetical protein